MLHLKMMMMNYFCGMVDGQKAFSLIFSQDHCQRSSPLWISDKPQAGFKPAHNLISGFIKWSCAVVITTTPQHILKLKKDNLPITAMIDNKNLHALINSDKLSQYKYIWIDTAAIKEMIKTNIIQDVRWIQSTNQLANCLTKQGVDRKSLVELLKNEFSIINNKEAN